MSEKIYTKNAPDAIGPYSQAVKSGNLLFTSGQIAINPATGNVDAQGIEAQTRQICENLKAVLAEAGCTLDNVIKTTCFLDNMNDFAAFNASRMLSYCGFDFLKASNFVFSFAVIFSPFSSSSRTFASS